MLSAFAFAFWFFGCTTRAVQSSTPIFCGIRLITRLTIGLRLGCCSFYTSAASKLSFVCLLNYELHHFGEAFVLLCRCFKVLNLVVFSHRLALSFTNLSLVNQIYFVSAKDDIGRGIGMISNGLHPSGNGIKCLLVCDVKRNNDAICSPVEIRRKRPKSLLTCSIPYFDRYFLAI